MAARANFRVTLIDRGFRRILQDQRSFARMDVSVGFPKEKSKVAPPRKKGSGHTPIKSFTELVTIAAVQEFGSRDGRIPSRPFMRTNYKRNKKEIDENSASAYNDVILGRQSPKSAQDDIGAFVAQKMRQNISEGNFVPLKIKTAIKKGSTRPLIDRVQMQASITHAVIKR